MPGLPGSAAVAQRIPLPALWPWAAVADREGGVRLSRLSGAHLGPCREDLPGQPSAPAGVVPSDVVGDEPEERDDGPGPPTRPGIGQLPDGLDVPAEVAARHDPSRSGTARWRSRGGRNLRRRG